jgi:hypothetical protein
MQISLLIYYLRLNVYNFLALQSVELKNVTFWKIAGTFLNKFVPKTNLNGRMKWFSSSIECYLSVCLNLGLFGET